VRRMEVTVLRNRSTSPCAGPTRHEWLREPPTRRRSAMSGIVAAESHRRHH
jgi:hypothetical protein